MTSAPSHHPYISFLPYLELDRVIAFGEWEIGPIEPFEGRWVSGRYEELAKKFVTSFLGRDGEPVKASLLARAGAPIDGTPPSHEEFLALQRTLHFCTLNHNPDLDDPGAALSARTTDNSELFVWPFDPVGGYVTYFHEAAVSMVAGGHMIETDPPTPLPREVWLPTGAATLYEEELAALLNIVSRDNDTARRIAVAVDWLAQAWRNSSDIRPQDRVVMLKTAFEALLKTSSTLKGSTRLQRLFDERLREHLSGDAPAASDLLWSPGETASMMFGDDEVTPIEHFFRTLGDARNQIIHDGVVPCLEYEADSAYAGPLFNIAERVLREAIRVLMIDLGYPRMWQDVMMQRLVRGVEERLRATRHNDEEPE